MPEPLVKQSCSRTPLVAVSNAAKDKKKSFFNISINILIKFLTLHAF